MFKRYTAFIIAFICAFSTNAYPQLYPFHNYTPSKGLSPSTIYEIYQDDKGYLWFATGAGVSRFDGLEFEIHNSGNGLADDCVYSILQDTGGAFWFGTYRGVSKYDGKNWMKIDFDQASSNYKVFSMLEDSRGGIWFGTDIGVMSLHDGQWKHLTVGDGLVDNYVNEIFEDKDGSMWFATRKGLSRFAGNKWTNYRVDDGLPHNDINSIVQDRKGSLWVGTAYGVGRFDGESWQAVQSGGKLLQRDVRTVYEDSRGNLWFGMRVGGVVKYDGAQWTTFTASNGLVHNRVTAIFEDRERNMWFGTERGGASQLTGEAFCHYRVSGGKRDDGLSGNMITSLLEDNRQRLWIGTCNGGVSVFDGYRWSNFSRDDGLPNNCVSSIFQRSNGEIWAGTERGGICRFDGKRWSVERKPDSSSDDDRINKIEEDNQGNLWFATNYGAIRFDGADWTGYTVENGLAANVVNDILQTPGGPLWFATGEGVSRFEGRKWKTFNRENGLAGNQVYHMYEDNDRQLWFATSEGVSRFDGQSFHNLTVADGLSSKFCYSLIGYQEFLFIGTSKGISRYDGQQFKAYSVQDGLSSNEISPGACLKDSQGNLWFGTSSGLTRFNPQLDRENDIPPPVYITSVTMGDTSLEVSRTAVLGHERDDIRFDFVSLCFTAPENLVYSYRLDGWDRDWEETDQRSLRYSNLPSGNYSFRVKARNNAGVWSESPAEFRFTLTPPFWNSIWFKSLFLVVLAGLLVAAVMRWNRRVMTREVTIKDSEIERIRLELSRQQQEQEKNNELRSRQQLAFESLADNIEDGIAVVSGGEIIFANRQLAAMLGTYKEKLLQREFASLVREDSRVELSRLGLSTRPVVKVVLLDNDKKEVWTEIQAGSIQWQGEPAELIRVRDISRQMIREFTLGDADGDGQESTPGAQSPSFGDIVGRSAPMQAVYKLIEKASTSSANVIVYGETGTGKELVARTIHNLSQRAGMPFVVVNCGAIPHTLFESEFFGHRKGAFTGAHEDKQGYFDIANGGTLFLDEVGELDASMQVKLLRAVEGEGYSAVGGGATRKSDVRIIGATNRDLSSGVKNGDMRSDFFYRMHIVPVTLPPLRERREDIPLLLKYFVSKHTGKSVSDIPGDILEKLYNYDWPGNVRQLQNVILRYLTVGQFDLMEELVEKNKAKSSLHRSYRPDTLNLKEETAAFEKLVIMEALKLTGGQKSKAAEILGITRRTLFRKINDYGLK